VRRRSPIACFECSDTTYFFANCPKRKKLNNKKKNRFRDKKKKKF
jgi:hypothetical protein